MDKGVGQGKEKTEDVRIKRRTEGWGNNGRGEDEQEGLVQYMDMDRWEEG